MTGFKKSLMVVEKKMFEREGKKTMFFLGCVGMALPHVELSVDEEMFNQVEEGQEFQGHFELKEMVQDAGYGKFKWGFKPNLVKIVIPK